jgi:glycosyltransferase involved in cell wall biosynthesis
VAALRIAILIPAFNEQQTIGKIVTQAQEFGDVFVSDDGSLDATVEIAVGHGAVVFSRGGNYGYNSALSFGCQSLLKKNYDGIVTMDGDGQHSPSDIEEFVEALGLGFDAVVGIRPKRARVMEIIFAHLTTALWKVNDPLCGMKAFSARLLEDKGSLETYNSVGTEVLLFALARRYRVKSVAISGGERGEGSSRFGGGLKANIEIGKALFVGLISILAWRRPPS